MGRRKGNVRKPAGQWKERRHIVAIAILEFSVIKITIKRRRRREQDEKESREKDKEMDKKE